MTNIYSQLSPQIRSQGVPKRLSLTQRALAILRRPGITADAYIPGIGTLSGLTAGNYTLSDGSTGVAVVDGPDGLVLDAAGTVGVELVTNGTNLVTTAGWTANGSATLSVVSGALRVTNGAAAFGFAGQSFATVIGQTYYLGPCKVGGVPSIAVNINIGNSLGGADVKSNVDASQPVVFVASATTTYLGLYAGSNTITNYTDYNNISVKQVTGIHASQSTAGFRPRLERGVRNLLLWSGDKTNAAWQKGNTTVSASGLIAPSGVAGQTITSTGTFAAINMQTATTAAAGQVVTAWAEVRNETGGVMAIVDESQGGSFNVVFNLSTGAISSGPNGGGATIANVGGGWYKVSYTYTVQVARTSVQPKFWVGLYNGTNTSGQSFTIGAAQLELGSTASDYSPTTTAAASNPLAGRYSWAFDGVDDRLQLASVPFQMADDHCVVAGAAVPDAATYYPIATPSSIDATNYPCSLVVETPTGKAYAEWKGGGNVDVIKSSGSVVGASFVLSGRKNGITKSARLNGQTISGSPTAVTTSTASTSGAIGASPTGAYFKGSIGPVIAIKGTVSDADLLMLERFVASLTPNAPSF
jgi:hypothetical protein